MLILEICNFHQIFGASLSFNCVALLLPKALSENLEPGGKHPSVLIELRSLLIRPVLCLSHRFVEFSFRIWIIHPLAVGLFCVLKDVIVLFIWNYQKYLQVHMVITDLQKNTR